MTLYSGFLQILISVIDVPTEKRKKKCKPEAQKGKKLAHKKPVTSGHIAA